MQPNVGYGLGLMKEQTADHNQVCDHYSPSLSLKLPPFVLPGLNHIATGA